MSKRPIVVELDEDDFGEVLDAVVFSERAAQKHLAALQNEPRCFDATFLLDQAKERARRLDRARRALSARLPVAACAAKDPTCKGAPRASAATHK